MHVNFPMLHAIRSDNNDRELWESGNETLVVLLDALRDNFESFIDSGI
jgi:hypothetical protein